MMRPRLPLLRFYSTVPPTASTASTASPTVTPALPYRVSRSATRNLPVYHRIQSGGSNKTTEVKKIEGDVRALSAQLAQDLGVETKINPRTNHISIKGFHKDKVVAWLRGQGF